MARCSESFTDYRHEVSFDRVYPLESVGVCNPYAYSWRTIGGDGLLTRSNVQ